MHPHAPRAHDPALFLPAQTPPANVRAPQLEADYRLFSDVCLLAPTALQTEALAAAERIYQVVWAWRPQPPTSDEVARAHQDAEAFRARLRREYEVVAISGERAPLALARGIPRGVLIESEDGRLHPIVLTATRTRQTRLEARLGDRLLRLPVTVAEPAILRGVLPGPGRVQAIGSDAQIRHGEAYKDIATVSEKPVVFRPASYKLPFFYSDGRFEVLLPPGLATLTAERGFEYAPVTQRLELAPGEVRQIALSPRRLIDMGRAGWISADTHVHWVKNSWDINESLALLAVVQRAEDIRVINNLTLYQWRPAAQGGAFLKPDHHPMGPVPGMCDREWHVQMGEELRNDNHYGHINLLGISTLIEPVATGPGSGGPPEAIDYPHNKTAILEARRQGGISVEAHNLGPFHASDVPVNVALGLSDSLDQLEPEHYYRFLNCGFHIGLTNGSDHPARTVGVVRCYARIEGTFTYRRWLDAVRRGRTFTTSGPLLFLSVNGKEIGETLDVRPGTRLRLRARALSRFPLGTVEVVANGQVVKRIVTDATHTDLALDLPADRSRWFCLRASRQGKSFDALSGPDIAHTAALYTRVDGAEVIDPDAVRFWLENIRVHRERLLREGRFASDAQRAQALAHIDAGRAVYEARLRRILPGP